MKGCIHDHTLMEDECSCDRPIMHTNSADAGLPHTSLTVHIADLESKLARAGRISGELAKELTRIATTSHSQPKTHACAIAAAQTKIVELRALLP